MSLSNDYQKLEPGNVVRLYEVDGTAFGTGEVLRFHAYNIPHTPEEIAAANPLSTIDLTDPTLDNRVAFQRVGAVSYLDQDGKINQASANQWPVEGVGGLGRFEPESASINGILRSGEINNAAWGKTRLITAGGFAAPDGTLTAVHIASDTNNNTHNISQNFSKENNTTYTYSIFLKAAEQRICRIQVGLFAQQQNPQSVTLDLVAGTAIAQLDQSRVGIQKFSNGWFRVWLTVTTNDVAGNIAAQLYTASQIAPAYATTHAGDGVSGVFVWGAQLEKGNVPTSYIPTVASPVTRPAANATIAANGASGVKITYSTGETTSLSFENANSVSLPVAGKPWGARYITKIEYTGGTSAYDESKLPAKSIWWQGNEYSPWPCQIEGIETSTSGSSAQPKLTVANLDGSITALCLAYDDMLQAKVSIHDTLAKYLDAQNFPVGNPTADPTQEKLKVYYIDSKSVETKLEVEFTLSSPMDLQGLQIPTRQLHSLCTWCMRGKYRSGDGCDYAGTAYFDKFNNPVSDPSLDACSGNLTGCKLRFGANNELPFGGFPGTSLIRS